MLDTMTFPARKGINGYGVNAAEDALLYIRVVMLQLLQQSFYLLTL